MLKVLSPIKITDAMLLSNTGAPESDHPAWESNTIYVAGARVIRTTMHRIYQCLVAISGMTPPEQDEVHWVEVKPTNRWAMFDSSVSTVTELSGASTQIKLKPGRCNGLALLGLSGINFMVITCSYPIPSMGSGGSMQATTVDYAYGIVLTTMTNSITGLVTMTYSVKLQNRNVSDWNGYFVEPFSIQSDVFIEFSSRDDMTISLDIGDANPKIGSMVVGNFIELGDVGYGVSSSIDDYSVVKTNEFGVSKLVERDYVKRVSYPVTVENWAIRRAFSTLASLRATPAVFIATDDYRYTPFTVFGRVARFSVALSFATYSIVNVEVQGLVL